MKSQKWKEEHLNLITISVIVCSIWTNKTVKLKPSRNISPHIMNFWNSSKKNKTMKSHKSKSQLSPNSMSIDLAIFISLSIPILWETSKMSWDFCLTKSKILLFKSKSDLSSKNKNKKWTSFVNKQVSNKLAKTSKSPIWELLETEKKPNLQVQTLSINKSNYKTSKRLRHQIIWLKSKKIFKVRIRKIKIQRKMLRFER